MLSARQHLHPASTSGRVKGTILLLLLYAILYVHNNNKTLKLYEFIYFGHLGAIEEAVTTTLYYKYANMCFCLCGVMALPPSRDWPPGICVLWCSSTWTLSMLNNLWRCTPAGRSLGTALWRDGPWSVRSNSPAVCCWGAPRLEPTYSSTSDGVGEGCHREVEGEIIIISF